MKKLLLTISVFAFAMAAKAQTIQFNNSTPCTVVTQYGASAPGTFTVTNVSGMTAIPPGAQPVFDINNTVWSNGAPAGPFEFTQARELNISPCLTGGTTGGCPNNISGVGAPGGPLAPSACVVFTGSCNSCPSGTPINIDWIDLGGGNILVNLH